MKPPRKTIFSAAILLSLVLSVPARAVYAQMPHDKLTLVAALFTSLTLSVLIIWFTLHRLMNKKLADLSQISLRHLPEQSIDLDRYNLVHNKIADLTKSFIQMSDEIDKRESELLRSNEFSSTILNNISDAVSIINPENSTIIAVNPAFLKLYKTRLNDVIDRDCQSVCNCHSLHPQNHVLCPGKRAVESGEFQHEQRLCQSGEDQVICKVNATPIIDHRGKVTQLIRVAHDITDSIHQQNLIHHMAYHDGLTGLPNRQLFKDRLEQAILQSSRNNGSGVIAMVDLDKFKQVNDTYGHACGDELLKIIAERLTKSIRSTDTVARMSGDEFLIIFREVDAEELAVTLAQQLLNSLTQPITLSCAEITIAASIGLCFFPKHGTNVDELLKCADSAMYSAKKIGHNNVHLAH